MTHDLHTFITRAQSGQHLTRNGAESAFEQLLSGDVDDETIIALLTALRDKGETKDEILGAVTAIRKRAVTLNAPEGSIDTCGTGGDAKGTYNISTTVAVVLAACGLPVAKHGNRSVSSKSGSADVLEHLGVKLDGDVATLEQCLNEAGICFMMAPQFHSAMKHVASARKAIGTRTIFNILGPLLNPASIDYQLLGVFDRSLCRVLAEVLQELGIKGAWVVHGADGLDEMSISGETYVCALEDGALSEFTVTPDDAGLSAHPIDALIGGDAEENADALMAVLTGAESAYRDAVLLNTAAALKAADKVDDLQAGVALAAEAIDSNRAHTTLQQWIKCSQGV
ncbi:MAG: anthranilate phosphoribosyltransferase [Rickettsiales bacterium]|nr:anthranilate phosphoribosyltransferase [Rickettsiales bacterium]